jgi:hypothetical protein
MGIIKDTTATLDRIRGYDRDVQEASGQGTGSLILEHSFLD